MGKINWSNLCAFSLAFSMMAFVPEPTPVTQQAERAANKAESQMLVIDYRHYPAAEYPVRITIHDDRSATLEPLQLNVVDLGTGARIPYPSPGLPPIPEDPETPDPVPGSVLDKVLNNFGDVQAYLKSKLKLKQSLRAPESGSDVAKMHSLVQEWVQMSLVGDVAKWQPWSDVWLTEIKAITADEYRQHLKQARESLGGD